MSDFFKTKPIPPLAEALRPEHLSDVVGQEHLLGPDKPLRLAFEAQKLHSMILWGPPGVGKTTLARLMAKSFDCEFIGLSAVFSGVKEIRGAVDQAELYLSQGKKTILLIDEIHRFNKSQQDGLLPYVESGLIILIGATTENPSFEINSALLSRTQVYVLKSLSSEELGKLFLKAQQKLFFKWDLEKLILNFLINQADGDARKFLNLLDAIKTAAEAKNLEKLELDFIQNCLGSQTRRFDKNGDYFYDQISALHKSVRGSDPDAALYWLCRMLDGGADPKYLSRRIIRMAWEDIGLADPKAMQIVNDAASTYERLGSPEGELALAQAVIYLAIAAKSNAGYLAYKEAKEFVKQDQSREVPIHLRNAPSHAYRYAHDEPHGYAAGENYFPEGMDKPQWYRPVLRGLEIKISEKLEFLKNLDNKKI